MPSFDIVSEVNLHTLTNAVDQANRVIQNRFDFNGVHAGFTRNEREVEMFAENDFQLKQCRSILHATLGKCDIDIRCIDEQEVRQSGKKIAQNLTMRHGIDKDLCKEIVKRIKQGALKIQAEIRGDSVRVSGKKRDNLQQVIGELKEASFSQPLQFINMRD